MTKTTKHNNAISIINAINTQTLDNDIKFIPNFRAEVARSYAPYPTGAQPHLHSPCKLSTITQNFMHEYQNQSKNPFPPYFDYVRAPLDLDSNLSEIPFAIELEANINKHFSNTSPNAKSINKLGRKRYWTEMVTDHYEIVEHSKSDPSDHPWEKDLPMVIGSQSNIIKYKYIFKYFNFEQKNFIKAYGGLVFYRMFKQMYYNHYKRHVPYNMWRQIHKFAAEVHFDSESNNTRSLYEALFISFYNAHKIFPFTLNQLIKGNEFSSFAWTEQPFMFVAELRTARSYKSVINCRTGKRVFPINGKLSRQERKLLQIKLTPKLPPIGEAQAIADWIVPKGILHQCERLLTYLATCTGKLAGSAERTAEHGENMARNADAASKACFDYIIAMFQQMLGVTCDFQTVVSLLPDIITLSIATYFFPKVAPFFGLAIIVKTCFRSITWTNLWTQTLAFIRKMTGKSSLGPSGGEAESLTDKMPDFGKLFEGLEVTSTVAAGLMCTIGALLFKITVGKNVFVRMCSLCGDILKLEKGISSLPKLLELLTDGVKAVARFFLGDAYQFSDAQTLLVEKHEEFIKWVEEVSKLDNDVSRNQIPLDGELRTHICKLRAQADRYLTILNTKEVPRQFNMAFTIQFRKLDELYKIVCKCELSPNLKYDPFVICLTGGPSVGKTMVVTAVGNAICDLQDVPKSMDSRIYYRNCSSQYWDRYYGQFCTLYEDFLQVKEGQIAETMLNEFIMSKGINTLPLNMAHLEEKGRVLIPLDMINSFSIVSAICPSFTCRKSS
nr:MAG: RNA-dependent RNA polymerase [Riboviria sp.]